MNPNEPGIVEYSHLDLEHPYRCGFLKMKKCYNMIRDRRNLNDWADWQQFVNAGFILKVREEIE